MPRYIIAPAVLIFALCAVLAALFALPSPVQAAHSTREPLDALLRLLSGRV
ncbi:MAG: hypothetical protein ACXWNK_17135 [Vulcanimicrobiaceae bacterium]